MTQISNRPADERDVKDTGGVSSIEALMIAKLGGKREYGAFRDRLVATTRKRRRGK